MEVEEEEEEEVDGPVCVSVRLPRPSRKKGVILQPSADTGTGGGHNVPNAGGGNSPRKLPLEDFGS